MCPSIGLSSRSPRRTKAPQLHTLRLFADRSDLLQVELVPTGDRPSLHPSLPFLHRLFGHSCCSTRRTLRPTADNVFANPGATFMVAIAGGAHPLRDRRALCWWNPRPVKQPYQYRCLHLRPTRLTDLPGAGLVQQVRHQSHR